jgi:hypothetical protein
MKTTEIKTEKKILKPMRKVGNEKAGKGIRGFGILKGKIHCDDSVWGFYGN